MSSHNISARDSMLRVSNWLCSIAGSIWKIHKDTHEYEYFNIEITSANIATKVGHVHKNSS